MMTVKDVQKILKLSRNKVYALVNTTDFPKIRFNNQIRIPKKEFDEFLKHNLYKKYEF